MAINNLSLGYIGSSSVNIALLATISIVLFRNFIQKRTTGTLILVLSYLCLLANEILITVSFLLQVYKIDTPGILELTKTFNIIGVINLVYTINWVYFFANRHILRDNDLFKSVYISIFGTFIGAVLALAILDIYFPVGPEPFWYTPIPLAGTEFSLYYPPLSGIQMILTVMFFAIGMITYVRIIFRTLTLRRKAKDIVTKKGFTIVTFSILSFLFTGLVLGVFIPSIGGNKIAWLAILLYVVRGIIVLLAVVFGYLGWIMPDWLRKSFRGKAWITKIYTGKLPEPAKSKENLPQLVESSTIVEVSEQ